MRTDEIRTKFLEFFKEKGHRVVESDLLVPADDPTLLFTGAGMNQFKEQFMGKNITFSRAASCQKCIRTGDLENVGKTPRHHTFFEMLGNFSFGDYFKKEAIEWAWEFMTGCMGIPEEKLWVSVYEDDDEAYDIWCDQIKVPEHKIVRLGEHDNFWPADAPSKGPNGPCGPCSEVFYDMGEGVGCGKADCDPSCDCDRFLEVWNLVFTQFERKPDGKLDPLPNKNIDTGMGLERIAAVMQGVATNFDTDIFTPLTDRVKKAVGELAVSDINLIADHIRAASFSIADGVSPSNERRGYVVRKLIRRAYLRSGKKEPFLFNLVPLVTELFKDTYPDLADKREHIAAIVEEEEIKFNETLTSAMPIMEEMFAAKPEVLEGEKIFKLADTYGMPFELIAEEAEKRGIAVDADSFERLMDERKEQSRRGSDITSDFIFQPDCFKDAPEPELSDAMPLKAKIAFILKEGACAGSASEGERVEVITSPQSGVFYAEGGGQAGDKGHITMGGARINVVNTLQTDGKKVLEGTVKSGSFKVGDEVTLELDLSRKERTARNHTATHLLQAALRKVLGEHVKQSGSLVDSRRLRFDFTHMKKLSDREIRKVQDMVNGWIKEGIAVCKEVKPIKEAKEEGALSFFGEKYGDEVRVVTVGDESKELCGGTHVENTAEIELVKIVNEIAVASGIRRIEALTGDGVREWMKHTAGEMINSYKAALERLGSSGDLEKEVANLAEAVKAADGIAAGSVNITAEVIDEFDDKVASVFVRAREFAERTAKKKQKKQQAGAFEKVRAELEEIVKRPYVFSDVKCIVYLIDGADMAVLRKAVSFLEKEIESGVVLLGGGTDDKAFLICVVTPDAAEKGADAGAIIGAIAGNIGGGGGGKATFAQAGGKDVQGLTKAMEEAKKVIEEAFK